MTYDLRLLLYTIFHQLSRPFFKEVRSYCKSSPLSLLLIHPYQLRNALALGIDLTPEAISMNESLVVSLMSLAGFGENVVLT